MAVACVDSDKCETVANLRQLVQLQPAHRHSDAWRLRLEQQVRKLSDTVDRLVADRMGLSPWPRLLQLEQRLDQLTAQLAGFTRPTTKPSDMQMIERLVCQRLSLNPWELRSQRHTPRLVRARCLVWLVARRHTDYSFPELARLFGRRNHTTVLQGVRQLLRLSAHDPELATLIAETEAEAAQALKGGAQ